MSDPTLNLELALPIRAGDLGFAVHVAVAGIGWQACTDWRATFAEAIEDRNNIVIALDQEAA